MSEDQTIRWQVPTPRDVVDQIDHLAEVMELPRSRMAVLLLETSVEARTHFMEWLSAKVVQALIPHSKPKPKAKDAKGAEEVRLELRISAKLANDIEILAERLNHTPVRMSTLLLKAGVDENSGMIEVVSSNLVRRLTGRPPKKSKKDGK